MTNIVEVAYESGINNVQFNTFNLAAVTSHNINDYGIYTSKKFILEYKKAVRLAEKLDIRFNSFFNFDTKPGFKKCLYPWSGFYITWDGYLVPCCTKPFPLELNFGNVFEEGVMNCLNGNKYRQFRKAWYENKTPAFCKRCQLIEIPKVDINQNLI
jgi:radical SAM protein with 4Fe4S-binding SPASM domain